MVMEKLVIDPMAVVNHALFLHRVFMQLQISSENERQQICRWKPPSSSFLKLNVDGAVFADGNKAGVGLVLRDENGKVVWAATKAEDAVDAPVTIELIAVLRGLQLCQPLGIPNLVVETDCLSLVQELQGTQESFSPNGNLIKDAKELMRHFPELQVQHVYRDGNRVAHNLARFAWIIDDIIMWWDSVPGFVDHALWFDQAAMY
ncbi:hypothetical protein F2P56_011176 [Juglans regia]|uniref:RNase H type-1 domain-containing protein n=2 Tax=Juglans regia TaxID=51240 RepID=A0A834CTV9_JUGRE|nr:uncharacterized protein LOC108983971 [Juglans regia]KAF5470679.1 hypothetical protein F2P56_011176 [Juglans regia]